MAKRVKNKWLGARADDPLFEEVSAYIDAADMTMGQLVRTAVKEYMWAHPRNSKPELNPVSEIKPEED